MRTIALATLLIVIFAAPALAVDPYFLTGECESAALTDHAWHEFGHDLTSLYVGQKPLSPGALWGDKWSEATPGFRTIAKGGLIMEIIVSSVDAGFEDDEPSCAPAMNTIGTMAYTARMRISPNNAGDFDPFTASGRNQMGLSAVTSSILLEALEDYRMKGSLFAGEPVPFAPSVFAAAEQSEEADAVATLPFKSMMARAGVVHELSEPESEEPIVAALPGAVLVDPAGVLPLYPYDGLVETDASLADKP
jgi:hypothetical protein